MVRDSLKKEWMFTEERIPDLNYRLRLLKNLVKWIRTVKMRNEESLSVLDPRVGLVREVKQLDVDGIADMSEDRLQRIEEKLDKLADVIVGMARVEEKIADLELRRSESHERLNRMSQKMDKIDSEVVSMRERMNVMTKIMWVIGAGIMTALITHFQEML